MGELLTSDPVNRWMNHLQKTITEQPEVSRSGITYVLPHLETGGTQRQMKELLLGLDRDLFEPRVVAFTRVRQRLPIRDRGHGNAGDHPAQAQGR
jgi:hypothetical protein